MKCREKPFDHIFIYLALSGLISCAQAAEPGLLKLSRDQEQSAGIQLKKLALPTRETRSAAGLKLSGQVVSPSNAQTIVSPVFSGYVREVKVSAMEPVRKGQVLATMSSPDAMTMQREYLQLAIQAKLAHDKKLRDESLFSDGIVSRSRMEESQAAYVQAEAAARERRYTLKAAGFSDLALEQIVRHQQLQATLTLTANISGTVTELNLQPGQKIESGMTAASISNNQLLWVNFQAAGAQAAQIKTGDLVSVPQCQQALKVTAIASHVQTDTQNRIVRAAQIAPEACLKLNQFVEGNLASAQLPADSFALPAKAIVQVQGNSWIFLRQPSGYLPARVDIVQRQGELVWIRGLQNQSLSAGTEVVVQGMSLLKSLMLGIGSNADGGN